jgi:hypothetical protein
MKWRHLGLGLLVLSVLSGCAGRGGLGSLDTVGAGQRVEDLVARQGKPQEILPGPGGGKTYVYTRDNLDQTAAMGGGAWVKPDQLHYRINDQGVITEVARYPYGKRSFLLAGKGRSPQPTQAASPPEAGPAPAAGPAPPAPALEAPRPPAAAPASPAKTGMAGLSRLDLNMSREEVQRLLGPPERTEGFRAGSRPVIVWYYFLENQQGRRVETPLVFEAGRLSGWGENYYRRRLRELAAPSP